MPPPLTCSLTTHHPARVAVNRGWVPPAWRIHPALPPLHGDARKTDSLPCCRGTGAAGHGQDEDRERDFEDQRERQRRSILLSPSLPVRGSRATTVKNIRSPPGVSGWDGRARVAIHPAVREAPGPPRAASPTSRDARRRFPHDPVEEIGHPARKGREPRCFPGLPAHAPPGTLTSHLLIKRVHRSIYA
jgi:hypothetical protein